MWAPIEGLLGVVIPRWPTALGARHALHRA